MQQFCFSFGSLTLKHYEQDGRLLGGEAALLGFVWPQPRIAPVAVSSMAELNAAPQLGSLYIDYQHRFKSKCRDGVNVPCSAAGVFKVRADVVAEAVLSISISDSCTAATGTTSSITAVPVDKR